MDELLEIFALEDAFHEFSNSDLCSASLALLQAMNYPIPPHIDIVNHSIENFLFTIAENSKSHYSAQEMVYLNRVKTASFLCKLHDSDLIDRFYANSSDDYIVFLAIDIISSYKDRSEDVIYISKILNKTYNGFVVLIIMNNDHIMFCTYIDDYFACMSDWYSVKSKCMDLFSLCDIFNTNIFGIKTVKEFYYELAYRFARNYIRYPESFEFIAYQLPSIKKDIVDSYTTKQQLIEIAMEQNHSYYWEKYGYDYVAPDTDFEVLLEEDETWTLLELDEFLLQDEDMEGLDENEDEELEYVDDDDIECEEDYGYERIDYSEVTTDIFKDPVRLLEWLEKRYRVED